MNTKYRERILIWAVIVLGISAIITQIVLMREFLTVFYGNELILGIILANWLFLTGVGAFVGKYFDSLKEKNRLIIVLQIFIAFLPFVSIFLIRTLRNAIFPVGSLIGIIQIFMSSFILLLPYCFISGFLLTVFTTFFTPKAESIGKVYFYDSLGGIIGGALFSFVLIFLFNPFQIMFFILPINLVAALLLAVVTKNVKLRNVLIFLILLSFIFVIIDFNKISTKFQYKNQELVARENSPYGDIVITRSQNQLNFYENGVILFSTDNVEQREETVHYAMVQNANPKNVLLISGGISGTIDEIIKYNVDKIDYVELDPKLIELGKKYIKSYNKKVNIVNADARLFIKKTKNKYDAVIIDLSAPSTAQINRYYTIEFFKELKRVLDKDSVVSLSLPSTENYVSKEGQQLNSALFKTLKQVFENVIIIPGGKNFFLASDEKLSYNIAERIKQKNISTEYVNEYYLKGILTNDRINFVMNSIDKNAKINADFSPVTYYYHLLYWLSYFRSNYIIFLGVVLILTVIFVLKLKPVSYAIFTIGLTASSLEVVLLIGFQIIYGYVYQMIGIIIAVFMLGLAIGSLYINKKLDKKNIKSFIKIEIIIVIYSIILPFSLLYLSKIEVNKILIQIIFSLLTLFIAILVGMEFPLASKLQFKNVSTTAAEIYNADLIGSAVGALLVSALLIPLIGIVYTCFSIGLLNILSTIILYINKK